MKILVISGCSASKEYDDGVNGEVLDRYPRQELIDRECDSQRVLPAREMYTGAGHTAVAATVDRLRAIDGIDVEWLIISAGFGTLESETPIVPYDCTFSREKHNKPDYRERADRLGIADRGQTIDELIRDIGQAKAIPDDILARDLSQYDCLFAMLGREYLLAAATLFEQTPTSTAAYVFAPDSMADLTGTCTQIPANAAEREAIGAMGIHQKELQFQTLMNHVDSAADLHALTTDPERVQTLSITPVEET